MPRRGALLRHGHRAACADDGLDGDRLLAASAGGVAGDQQDAETVIANSEGDHIHLENWRLRITSHAISMVIAMASRQSLLYETNRLRWFKRKCSSPRDALGA